MADNQVRKYGDPVLRNKCRPVTVFDEELKKLAEKASLLRDKSLSSKEKDEMFISLTDARRFAVSGADDNNRGG